MRDYSFGNRLTMLRKEKGLSQFQLGTLLGVSDKAVSKWENGVAKPKLEVCLKLADLLGIGMDDLLCQRSPDAEKEQRIMKQLKKALWERITDKLYELYGDQPSLSVLNRFELEKSILQDDNSIFLLNVLADVRRYLAEKGLVLLTRGYLNGSFVAWLMEAAMINPLPAHTRSNGMCSKCGTSFLAAIALVMRTSI